MATQMRLDDLHKKIKSNKWLQRFTVLIRILLALGFTPSGLTKLLGNRFTLLGPETTVGYFFDALYKSGFYKKKVVVRNASSQGKNVPKKTVTRKAVSPLAKKAILAAGQPAPEFTLPNDEGQLVSLADYRGQKILLYFYPEDDTPGCTKEACSFRDGLSALHQRRAVVLGVSADSVDSHVKFKQKFHLNFSLWMNILKKCWQRWRILQHEHRRRESPRRQLAAVSKKYLISKREVQNA